MDRFEGVNELVLGPEEIARAWTDLSTKARYLLARIVRINM